MRRTEDKIDQKRRGRREEERENDCKRGREGRNRR
jgi:hypothetical protein